MAIVLVFGVIEVSVMFFREVVTSVSSGNFLLNNNGLMRIFDFFLIVLIGFELFETVKLYLDESVFHGEVILMVSLIAIARKVIILDYSKEDPMTIFGIVSIITAVYVGYFLIKKTMAR